MDNLRAALAWALGHDEIEAGLWMAGALRWVWEMRGYLEEGVGWFTKLFAAQPQVLPALCAKALQRASELAGQLAHEPHATRWAQAALRLARMTNDPQNLAWSLATTAYFTERDGTQAMAMLDESLALFQELQDPCGLSHVRRLAGCALDQQNYAYATVLLDAALASSLLIARKSAPLREHRMLWIGIRMSCWGCRRLSGK